MFHVYLFIAQFILILQMDFINGLFLMLWLILVLRNSLVLLCLLLIKLFIVVCLQVLKILKRLQEYCALYLGFILSKFLSFYCIQLSIQFNYNKIG